MHIRGLVFPPATYRRRRSAASALLAEAFTGKVPLLVLAKSERHALVRDARQDPWFDYYTGCHEPEAALLIDPGARQRDQLFIDPGDPKRVVWDGPRLQPGAAAVRVFGVDAVRPVKALAEAVERAARRAGGRIALLWRGWEPGQQAVMAGQWRRRLRGIEHLNAEPVLSAQRMVKEAAEVAWHRRAVAVTAAGLKAVLPRIPALSREAEVAGELAMHYRRHGWEPLAFPSIVGSGVNGATLHYPHNDRPLERRRPLLIDSGATAGGYCADVTRTVPQHGRFSDRRFRAVYELVLSANQLVCRSARPGMTREQLNELAWRPITDAGFTRHHGVSHQIGLDVHDPFDRKDWVLRPGMVISNEPGIYLPEEGFGVRIEDDLLITAGGCEVLTRAIPKTVDEVEAAMRG
jgi:Xaa-Pro aminopeptidase